MVERETPSSRYEDSVHGKACSELLGGDLALGLETSPDVREVREKDAENTDSTRVKDFWGKKKIYSKFFRGKKSSSETQKKDGNTC